MFILISTVIIHDFLKRSIGKLFAYRMGKDFSECRFDLMLRQSPPEVVLKNSLPRLRYDVVSIAECAVKIKDDIFLLHDFYQPPPPPPPAPPPEKPPPEKPPPPLQLLPPEPPPKPPEDPPVEGRTMLLPTLAEQSLIMRPIM